MARFSTWGLARLNAYTRAVRLRKIHWRVKMVGLVIVVTSATRLVDVETPPLFVPTETDRNARQTVQM